MATPAAAQQPVPGSASTDAAYEGSWREHQRFEYSRPIVAGDELLSHVTIDGIRSVAGNDMITTRTDISTTDGEHVVTSYTVLVARATDSETA